MGPVPAAHVDLLWQNTPQVIATWLAGDAVVDPGPACCVDRLLNALGDLEPRHILVTHLHLDHAAAVGTLVRRFPSAQVYAHARAVPHLADPTRLLRSAERIYGTAMQQLWGDVVPVPSENLHAVAGGDYIERFEVLAAPGHAGHHLAFLEPDEGLLFAGDAAGVRVSGSDSVFPSTPPPELDVDAWLSTLARFARSDVAALALTHCGRFADVDAHLASLGDALQRWAGLSRTCDRTLFLARAREELRGTGDHEVQSAMEKGLGLTACWDGLARWARLPSSRSLAEGRGLVEGRDLVGKRDR